MSRLAALSLVLAACVYFPALAQDKAKDNAADLRGEGQTVVQISPIFSQLLLLSYPRGFKTVFEQTNGNGSGYIRESVLEGETVDQWSQMITVTGAKGLAAAYPNVTPQQFVGQMATGFKRACPDTFSSKDLGAIKISGQDAVTFVASCGTVQSASAKHSESVLLIAIKGAADYYTVQWAERGPASGQPIVLADEKWADRFTRLNPIKVCPRIAGEAAPYPSCINQK